MPVQFSLAHLTVLGLAPPAMIDAAKGCGYDFVSLRLLPVTPQEAPYRLDQDAGMKRETLTLLADTGIKVLDIELFRLLPDVRVSDFKPALEVGAELGARHVIAGALDGDIARLADHFAQLCDLAAPFGMTVNLEPVSFFPISDVAHGAAVVRRAGCGNGGLLIDTLHFSRAKSDPAILNELPRHWFNFAQLSDAPAEIPAEREEQIHTARAARLYLGEGGIDVRGITAHLPPIPYSLENPNEAAVAALGWEEHARRTLVAARRYMTDERHARAS